jgi:hypothetical protein
MAYTTIDDPSAYFQTALWSGDDATTQNITNDGNSDLQPDWVWVKCRNTAGNGFDHTVWDTSRGVDNNVNKSLSPSQTDSEGLGDNVTTTAQLGGVSAMLSDGFTVREGSVDNDSRYVNENSRTYVGWQWKANGGTTTTNDASSTSVGTIDSVYQANTTAGFSIITYTGTGSAATVAHGLGVKPEWIVIKNRGKDEGWAVYHGANTSAPETDGLSLNSNNATSDSADYWNDTAPTTTTFSVAADDRSGGSYNFVAYVFNSVQGYSKFGSYTGNQSTDGPFLYFGFKPAFLMVKKTSSTENWFLIDNKRHPINDGQIPRVIPNNSDAESEDASIAGDFLSNGFKIRATQNMINESGTYIYMAFAESPFVSSKGVPTTAR